MMQFITVSSDCIRLKTDSLSNTYANSGLTGCFDFVSLNTTYTDSQGNLRSGRIEILAKSATSGAKLLDTLSPSMIICLICTTVYLAFI